VTKGAALEVYCDPSYTSGESKRVRKEIARRSDWEILILISEVPDYNHDLQVEPSSTRIIFLAVCPEMGTVCQEGIETGSQHEC
jgi:hypothetical protein